MGLPVFLRFLLSNHNRMPGLMLRRAPLLLAACLVSFASAQAGGNGTVLNGTVCPKGDNGAGASVTCSGHGRCDKATGTCSCFESYSGVACGTVTCPSGIAPVRAGNASAAAATTPRVCSGKGVCTSSGICECKRGYMGPACDLLACPPYDVTNLCNGKGECNTTSGTCSCQPGSGGEACGQAGCPAVGGKSCSGRGNCNEDGQCVCHVGHRNGDLKACERLSCIDNATGVEDSNCTDGHGYCRMDGVCDCFAGFSGALCQIQVCPMDAAGKHCSGHGHCVNDTQGGGSCECHQGYSGRVCENRLCPNDCSGHGVCTDGRCFCFARDERGASWDGEDCSFKVCPKNCWNNGVRAANGTCMCKEGFFGEACEWLACPKNPDVVVSQTGPSGNQPAQCSGQGVCDGYIGKCRCDKSWHGKACGMKRCEHGCGGHGRCGNGTCICDSGWRGDFCDIPTCKRDQRSVERDTIGELLLRSNALVLGGLQLEGVMRLVECVSLGGRGLLRGSELGNSGLQHSS